MSPASPETIARTAAYFQNQIRTMRLRESCDLPFDPIKLANARRLQLIEEAKLAKLGWFLTHEGLLVELPTDDRDALPRRRDLEAVPATPNPVCAGAVSA